MDKKKSTILLTLSPEEKEAIQIVAASEYRNVANFIKSIILNTPKVKEVLEQGNFNPIKRDEHKEVEEEVPEQKQVKQKEVPQAEKQESRQTEQKEIDMKGLTHSFKL